MMHQSKVIIFSAPSGAGKTTIVKHLLEKNNYLAFSISATTRPKRTGEKNGKDYYFLSPEVFREKISQDEFIEYEQVYEDLYYGTLKSEVVRISKNRKHLVADVDVKGGLALKRFFKHNALAVFIRPPSIKILRERLAARNTESEMLIYKRMKKVSYELSFEESFDATIVNNQLTKTFDKAQQLLNSFIE